MDVKNSIAGQVSRLMQRTQVESIDCGSEFEKTFDSVGSGIKIINGSFSTLKPVSDSKPSEVQGALSALKSMNDSKPRPSNVHGAFSALKQTNESKAGPSGIKRNAKPAVTYTPYEDISENEEQDDRETREDTISTFNEESYLAVETIRCEEYIREMTSLMLKSEDMVHEKQFKRARLDKKLQKHKKNNAIRESDFRIRYYDKIGGKGA